MIPYEVDPSLHPAEPAPARLDDGFSPPAETPSRDGVPQATATPEEAQQWVKSEF